MDQSTLFRFSYFSIWAIQEVDYGLPEWTHSEKNRFYSVGSLRWFRIKLEAIKTKPLREIASMQVTKFNEHQVVGGVLRLRLRKRVIWSSLIWLSHFQLSAAFTNFVDLPPAARARALAAAAAGRRLKLGLRKRRIGLICKQFETTRDGRYRKKLPTKKVTPSSFTLNSNHMLILKSQLVVQILIFSLCKKIFIN